MANKLEQHDGDLLITGNLEVIGTINETDMGSVLAAAQKTSSVASVLSNHLDNLFADNKLTPTEKLAVKKEWDAIAAMDSEVLLIATQNGIAAGDTEYDAYVAAYNALNTYLNGDPNGVIFVLTTTTTIVAATIRTKFSDYYSTREALVRANRTTTPETPLGSDATAIVRSIALRVRPQIQSNGYTATLANSRCWDVQDSDGESSWDALRFDGVDWKGTIN